MINEGFKIIPKCESHTRSLIDLPENDQLEVWHRITNTIEEKKINQKTIEKFVNDFKSEMIENFSDDEYYQPTPIKKKRVLIAEDTLSDLKVIAESYGQSLEDYLKAITQKEKQLGKFINEDDQDYTEEQEEILREIEKQWQEETAAEVDELETATQIIKVVENLPTEKVKEEIKFSKTLASNLILIFNLVRGLNKELSLKPT